MTGTHDSSRSNRMKRHDSTYRLVPPEVYVVFGADLEVRFHMPGDVSLPNAFVQLQGLRPRDQAWIEVTTMGLPLTRKTGTLTVACGIVEFAGRYSLTMVMQVDGPVLTQATFTSVWPSLTLTLPDTHSALTSPVIMEIESRAACPSRLQREFATLDLYFQRFEDAGSSFVDFSSVERVTAANFTALDNPKLTWQYSCKIFDLDGYYQAALRSSSGTTLTVSNVMTSTFSATYHLSSERASVFPCDPGSSVSVMYTQPSCAEVDKFRVYKLSRRISGSPASPVDRKYVGEFEASPDRSRFELGCETFRQEGGRGRRWSGTAGFLPQDGGWGSWTVWTTCSVTCGSGKRSRFRICNNPLPEHGGRHCSGHPVQWSYCLTTCPDLLPRSPLRSPVFDPNCQCGCTLTTTSSGEIVGTGRCVGRATWIIKTTPNLRVVLSFRYYSISYEKQWVKIRDGGKEGDELLYYSHHQPQAPGDVTSSSNVMRVELMTSVDMTSPVNVKVFPRNATVPVHVRGFIASYSVTVPDTAELPPPLNRHEEASIMDNEITIVGIAVVGTVVLTVIVFAAAQRKIFAKRVPRYSPAAKVDEAEGSMGRSGGSSGGLLESRAQISDADVVPFVGERGGGGRPGKSSSDPRLASRNSGSITSTTGSAGGHAQGRARAHTTTGTAARGHTARGRFSPSHFHKDPGYRIPARSASVGDRLHDHPKTERGGYAGVVPMLLDPACENRLRGELTPFPGYTPVSPPPPLTNFTYYVPVSALPHPLPASSTKQEHTKRGKRRKKKGVSASSSGGGGGEGGGGGGREAVSSSRVSSSTNRDVPSGRVSTTKAEINFTIPEGYPRPPSDSTTKAEINFTSHEEYPRPPSDSTTKAEINFTSHEGYLRPPSGSTPAGNVKSPVDRKERHARREDRSRRRSDGEKSFQKEQHPLIHGGAVGEPLSRQSRVGSHRHRPISTQKETSFHTPPTAQITKPLSLTDDPVSSKISRIKNIDPKTPSDTQPARNQSKRLSNYSGKYSAVEEETFLPTTQDRISNCSEKGAETKIEEDSRFSSPSKNSSSGGRLAPVSERVLSPSRSDVVAPELEYDDFVLEDTKSQFQCEDLNMLGWTGSEKLNRSQPKEYT
ncbi:hypothetical protein ACOMHN_037294 [Nucella lapillus]